MDTSSSSCGFAPFINVCNKELSKKNFYAVYDRIKPLSAGWKQIAISWHLELDTINRIEADCRGDTIACLQKVIEFWLRKDYDYESHGIPCWRRVCVAVKEGGGDPALADEIAREHPLPATVGVSTDVIHNEGMSPGSIGNRRDAISPGNGKSNSSTGTDGYGYSEKSFHLASKLHDLQDEFDEAIRITKKAFKSSDLPKIIDYLNTHVKSLLGPKKIQQTTAQTVREEFKCIETIPKLFTLLQDKYISWFNYKLMIKLVGVFRSKNCSLKRTWSAYEEKLKDYFINSGGLLKDADAVQFGVKGVPPGTRVMIAKVDRDDYTLDDIFFFRRAIPQSLDIPEYNLYFCFVHIGSLCLGYLIPEYVYSLLFPLTTKIQQQLASIGITELTFGEDIYNLKEVLLLPESLFPSSVIACKSGVLALVHKLESLNLFSPNSFDFWGFSILHYSSMNNNDKLLKYLLNQYQLSIDVKNQKGRTPLHIASCNAYGRTPLIYSCWSGSINSVKYLINNHDSDPNVPDKYGMTCIHYSCRNGHIDVTQYLIEGRLNLIQYILEHIPSSLELPVRELEEMAIMDPFLTAVYFNQLEVIKYLTISSYQLLMMKDLEQLVNISVERETFPCTPDDPDNNGYTSVHNAREAGSMELVQTDLKRNALAENHALFY
ncbi:PREDICTED: uncharacterized protein LOC109585040 [Amphimedon queenslandica]|uniref:Death domain-containing protein n=1 Tax=Amphimedon queenslandica TaxID=400682 RepID=A0AAN0JIL9_AMPQE|nr:PREDICTED: uncharacterized protein LOC109585040 [Amphimedon queenslandica]|eukprot:XP_019856523.1 PREDICTED: uncharacterized protein LOC109585040 [Amphimedon queenslandica]